MQLKFYQERAKDFSQQVKLVTNKATQISVFRFLVFLGFSYAVYRLINSFEWVSLIGAILMLLLFIFFIRWHKRISYQKKFYEALLAINNKEATFLQTNKSTYNDGTDFMPEQHPYALDLDLFKQGGLFQSLNRCSTRWGESILADSLLQPDKASILARQTAIQELKDKVNFRQRLQAAGIIEEHKESDWQSLLNWMKEKDVLVPKGVNVLCYIMPVVTIGIGIWSLIDETGLAQRLFNTAFIINMILIGWVGKKIFKLISIAGAANNFLKQYKEQLILVEKEFFVSPYIQKEKEKLFAQEKSAAVQLEKGVYLFNQLETVLNVFISIVLNGLGLYHIHVLRNLQIWRNQNRAHFEEWINVIACLEALNSYANFAFNNPSFCVPNLKAEETLWANEMAHPLLKEESRISNNVDFSQQRFSILTGSNMSGKSTFLRTVGVNLVLANAGSVVCAKEMNFYPFDVFASMRINDSLVESESLFFAELKRLKSMMAHVQANPNTFVILDEILRGTNSNDKRNGTILFIKKLMEQKPFGMIATHDVVVAELKKEMPTLVQNHCFESYINGQELYFDYKLKEGVCATMNASFLMKQMGIN